MSELDDVLRRNAANEQADNLGYRIVVNLVPRATPLYAARAFATGGEDDGRFLCYRSSSLDALEDGAEILRGIVEDDEPWPDQT